MTAAALAAALPEPIPDPLLAAILAGHGAPPVAIDLGDLGDFCVNAGLFEQLRRLAPAQATRAREGLARIISSQDAARLAGWATYGIPRAVVATSVHTRQQVRRHPRRKLDPGVRARQRDRYKRAAADSLDGYARLHLQRDPRAGLWRPRWLDHKHGCHLARCNGCVAITIPAHRRDSHRSRHRGRTSTISIPQWLLDRSAAMRACRDAVGLLDRVCGGVLVVPQSCHVRTCPDCEAARQAKVVNAYAAAVEALDPERVRFLTATLVNAPRGELAAGVDRLATNLAKLQRRALWRGGRCRDRAGCSMPPDPDRPGWKLPHGPVTAAMTSIEVTYNAEAKSWHPHAHLLIEGDYLPQDELARAWQELTGDSRIVWIESVRRYADRKWAGDVKAALRELLKYAAKPTPAFLDPAEGGILAELLVALRGRHLMSASGKLYGLDLADDEPDLDLVLVLPDNPDQEPYRAPRICPLHGGEADWAVHGYLPRRDCRAVDTRAGPRRAVLAWTAPAEQDRAGAVVSSQP